MFHLGLLPTYDELYDKHLDFKIYFSQLQLYIRHDV